MIHSILYLSQKQTMRSMLSIYQELLWNSERVNTFGRGLLDMCCTQNIHIVNGRVNGDMSGEFTCIANEGQSLVDYHIVSSGLFPYINQVCVGDIRNPDHFPISSLL